MHNKIYALICTVLVAFSLIVPAFAVEPTDEPLPITEEINGSYEEVFSEVVEEDISEGSEMGSEGSETDFSEGNEDILPNNDLALLVENEASDSNLIVDVSENSIQAIADAVSSSPDFLCNYEVLSGMFIPFDLLVSYDVVLFESSSQYDLMAVPRDIGFSLYQDLGSTGTPIRTDPWGTESLNYVIAGKSSDTLNSVFSYSRVLGVACENILWSNFDVYDKNGNLVHSADMEGTPSFIIFFDTGFDDLVVDSQSSKDLVLPTLFKSGYSFLGWYLDEELTQPVTDDYFFTADTTLYAKWEELPAMVFFTQSIFDSLVVFFSSEPIFYILSLVGLVIVIASIRVIITSRY